MSARGGRILALLRDTSLEREIPCDGWWCVRLRWGSARRSPRNREVVVADDSGALFFPPDLVRSVLDSATERSALEEYERELLRSQMHRFRDVYPLSPELREQYEAQRQRR